MVDNIQRKVTIECFRHELGEKSVIEIKVIIPINLLGDKSKQEGNRCALATVFNQTVNRERKQRVIVRFAHPACIALATCRTDACGLQTKLFRGNVAR